MVKKFLLSIVILLAMASTTGCFEAAKAAKKVTQPKANLVIPSENCVDKVRGTEETLCVSYNDKPDWAKCKYVLVHYTCTKVAPKGKK